MANLDLNLLYALVALDDRRSVSGAALALEKSQPATSAALGKLRQFFEDPLFVRVGNSMQPTPRAVDVIASARAVLGRINADMVKAPAFDPAGSHQPVSLALSDAGEMTFLPPVLKELRRLMPSAPVRSVSLPAQEVARDLESGSVDLAVGYFPDLKKHNFYQQTLFTETFASVIRSGHPVTSSRLTLKQYLRLEHAVVRAESRTEEVMERYLARKRIERRVVLTTPHFASVPTIVAQSDLIATIPRPLALQFTTTSTALRMVGMPFEPPPIALKQFWHRKFHEDARNRWLRALVFGIFGGGGKTQVWDLGGRSAP